MIRLVRERLGRQLGQHQPRQPFVFWYTRDVTIVPHGRAENRVARPA
jgi:hypothetical protein